MRPSSSDHSNPLTKPLHPVYEVPDETDSSQVTPRQGLQPNSNSGGTGTSTTTFSSSAQHLTPISLLAASSSRLALDPDATVTIRSSGAPSLYSMNAARPTAGPQQPGSSKLASTSRAPAASHRGNSGEIDHEPDGNLTTVLLPVDAEEKHAARSYHSACPFLYHFPFIFVVFGVALLLPPCARGITQVAAA